MAGHTPWAEIRHKSLLDIEHQHPNRVFCDGELVGVVSVEPCDGNVVITVERIDESKFGPVSVVVV